MRQYGSFEEAVEDHNHNAMVRRHEIKRMLSELKEDQLRSLVSLFELFSHEEHGPLAAAYFHGQASVLLEVKFNVCVACGESPCVADHGLENLLPNSKGTEESDPSQVIPPMASREALNPLPDLDPLRVGESGMLTDTQLGLMNEYHLDDIRDNVTNKLLGFICLGCKSSRYPSIEDRMMKPPGEENCPGCVHKQKWG